MILTDYCDFDLLITRADERYCTFLWWMRRPGHLVLGNSLQLNPGLCPRSRRIIAGKASPCLVSRKGETNKKHQT